MKLTTENIAIFSLLFTVITTTLKFIFGKIIAPLSYTHDQANKRFFIPSYNIVRQIIFDKITENNIDNLKNCIVKLNILLKIQNTRYYVPESLVFLIDDLSLLLDNYENKCDIVKVNAAYQKFSNSYFFYYNLCKGSFFQFEYSITSKHKPRVLWRRLLRLFDFLIAAVCVLCIIYLVSFLSIFVMNNLIKYFKLGN